MKKIAIALVSMALAGVGFAAPLASWVTNSSAIGVIRSNSFANTWITNGVTNVVYNTSKYSVDTNDLVYGILGWVSDSQFILMRTDRKPVLMDLSDMVSLAVTGSVLYTGERPTVDKVVLIASNNYRSIVITNTASYTNFVQKYDCDTAFKVRLAGINADGTLSCIGAAGGLHNVPLKDVISIAVPAIQPADSLSLSLAVAAVPSAAAVSLSSTNFTLSVSNSLTARIMGLQTATNSLRVEIAAVSNAVGVLNIVGISTNVYILGATPRWTNQFCYDLGTLTNINLMP